MPLGQQSNYCWVSVACEKVAEHFLPRKFTVEVSSPNISQNKVILIISKYHIDNLCFWIKARSKHGKIWKTYFRHRELNPGLLGESQLS